jgi:hypothetical protein
VPSRCELNVSIVAGLKTAPSTPAPIGNAAMIYPVSELSITIIPGARQAANST